MKQLKERLKHLAQWPLLLLLSSLVLIRRQCSIEERAWALESGKCPVVYQVGHLGQLFDLSEHSINGACDPYVVGGSKTKGDNAQRAPLPLLNQ